ncbi:hypothetical protein J1N09_14785 [Aureitalea sp. L0-47]|uniref:hypothetical protein n=1 Tax=Aureitalea sp. L0-47 TaxID=2816962 RepID=UPI002237B035|nr:hypothetical protein [Aureitalea sp. L0-47]MCW5521112.1 hypothetical protein [Aureitalea sp. L0-47]
MKGKFLNNEIWILTFGGGFQRANIYKKNHPETVRTAFRSALRNKIEELVSKDYKVSVFEDSHIENIQSLVTFSKNLKVANVSIPINFGVAQKLLNLYLKYQWCLGNLKENPPHFPVDRLIQIELNKEAKKMNLPRLKVEAWTQFEDDVNYRKIIDHAKAIRDRKDKKLSLAELELSIFERQSNRDASRY